VSDADTDDSDSVVVPCSPRLTHLTSHDSGVPTGSPSLSAHLHVFRQPSAAATTRIHRKVTCQPVKDARRLHSPRPSSAAHPFSPHCIEGVRVEALPGPSHLCVHDPQTRARQKMKTRRISTLCRHGARENVNMSLIKVMQALVNLQADTCERSVDAMAPSHAKNERGR
jgi:hypothetical protein